MINRSYYSNTIKGFKADSTSNIVGELTRNYSNRRLDELQVNAWQSQIEILQNQLGNFKGQVYFEFTIPRMGKRVDNIVIIGSTAFIIEFKVGADEYQKHAVEQVIDYSLDLKNFHEGSHHITLIPLLVATNALPVKNDIGYIKRNLTVAYANKQNLQEVMALCIDANTEEEEIDVSYWESSIYKPTPTIVEAAKALYKGHNVKEITRSDSGAINLSRTAACINQIVEHSKKSRVKSICFITGVPGAGKTLAGLNIANERMHADENEGAVFLSGNGPLVEVLREALARDASTGTADTGKKISKKESARKANAFIQNIHHFRNDNIESKSAPSERVVVFDEAQRAWDLKQVSSFMKRKKGIESFGMSEPEFLINVMNRHNDWCTIICLIGGGQEINTGEAGLEEWVSALKTHYGEWEVHYSNVIIENENYLKQNELKSWLEMHADIHPDLHLAVSVRSFRSEKLSSFIHDLLELDVDSAQSLYRELQSEYPIVLTRDLDIAKQWLKKQARGTERIGLIASSGARRLRPCGINVKNEIQATHWFLDDNDDVRSSYFLEEVATEFDIQGLEIDWACVAWGANLHLDNNLWQYKKFKGSKWQNINTEINKKYLKNTYRVLLTRARQGMVIFIPEGSNIDKTRVNSFYDETYNYLKKLGISELTKTPKY